MLWMRLAVPLFVAVMTTPLAAQDDDEATEPLQELFLSEVVYPQHAREVQVSTVFGFHGRPRLDLWSLAIALEYGFTSRLQLGAELPYESLTPAGGGADRGLGRPSVSALYAILPPGHGLALSGAVEASLPSLSDEADDGVEWEAVLAAGLPAGPLVLHGAIELELEEQATPVFALAVFPASGRVLPVLELFGALGGDEPMFLTPGLVWNSGALELSLGVPIALNDAAPRRNLIVKGTIEFDL